MPLAYNPTTADGRAKARDNEFEVLRALRYFGHLRRQELARLVWTNSSERSGYLMLQRTLRRLLQTGLVMLRRNILGGESVILTNKGVDRLRTKGLSASDGYALSVEGPNFYHRTLSNCYLIDRVRQKSTVFSEYAIVKDYWLVPSEELRLKLKKIPDGLVVLPIESVGLKEGRCAVEWVEVESAYKAKKVLYRIFDIARQAGYFLKGFEDIYLERVIFVYNSDQGHEAHILGNLKQYMTEHSINNPEFLHRISLVSAAVDIPFVWHGYLEATAHELMKSGREFIPMQEEAHDEERYDDS